MVALPVIDEIYFPGLEVSLWFLAECIHKNLSHEQYRRLLAIGFKEAESQAKKGGKAEAMSTTDNTAHKPRPRVNAPKVPFKAKRRTKRKKVVAPPPGPVARHEVSPELASALRATEKAAAGGTSLAKVLLDRIIWTCKSGQLPGFACECAFCCDDLFAGLSGLGGSLGDID